jgi:hypothetical protein
MSQQTAVEWLQYLHKEGILIKKSFEIAKAMEKEQIKFAYNDGADAIVANKYKAMDDYYNEQYGK